MNIKVIQTGIKQYSSVLFSIISNIKQIGSEVFSHMTMFNIYFIKSHQQSPLSWIFLMKNKFSMSFNKPIGCGNILKLVKKSVLKFVRRWTLKFLIFYTIVTLNENVELSGLYHHTKFERNRSVNVWIQTSIKVLVTKSDKNGCLPWIMNGWDKVSMRFITS